MQRHKTKPDIKSIDFTQKPTTGSSITNNRLPLLFPSGGNQQKLSTTSKMGLKMNLMASNHGSYGNQRLKNKSMAAGMPSGFTSNVTARNVSTKMNTKPMDLAGRVSLESKSRKSLHAPLDEG